MVFVFQIVKQFLGFYAWKKSSIAKTRLATTSVMLKMMKQMRSMTAAASIQSLCICWCLSVWRRSWASLRTLVSSRSLIELSRRSTELMLDPADEEAAAVDDASVDVTSSCLTLFDAKSTSRKSTLTSVVSVVSGALIRVSVASCSHTIRRICTSRHFTCSILRIKP